MDKHYTVSVMLVSYEKPTRVLLGFHHKLQKWLPPGGHQDPGENPLETIIRETHEETGFDIAPYLPKGIKLEDRVTLIPTPDFFLEEGIPAHNEHPAHIHMDWNYIIHVPLFQPTFPKREYDKMQWFTKDETIGLDTFSNIREFILPKCYKDR